MILRFGMLIAVVKETAERECRVALTPSIVKRFAGDGVAVVVEKKAGVSAGFSDEEYLEAGATVAEDFDEAVKNANVVATVSPLPERKLMALKPGTTLIGTLKPHKNLESIRATKTVNRFALELIPRISRAQSMDALSSQSNLAGYRAVIEAAFAFDRALPLMMTAAGTVRPAKALVLGVGVAGLQAIATAKRLGAVVSAFDVRSAAKEQAESLGADFIEVAAKESGDGQGGYAKEMSEEYKNAQASALREALKTRDIVITTALIPGKPAPVLITEEMVAEMRPGSVIVDLAIEEGGNCALSKEGESVTENGVKIVAHSNLPSRVAHNASELYAKNFYEFTRLLINKDKELTVDFDDEIIAACCLSFNGDMAHPAFGKGE